MYLLKPSKLKKIISFMLDSHSTMYLLKHGRDPVSMFTGDNSHSTMYLLKHVLSEL